MANRPAVLCKLQKGVLIDVQQGFVDTFNWMVDFINNLKGEGEVDSGKSDLVVDRSVSDNPVIRGGSKGKSSDSGVTGKLRFKSGEDSNVSFGEVFAENDETQIEVDVYYV